MGVAFALIVNYSGVLTLVEHDGVRFVEGPAEQPVMARTNEASLVIEACFTHGVRLAVVCSPGSVQFSSRFREMLAEEQLRRDFRVFETSGAAREWLTELPGPR
jgi:hypothetical protein